jgi:alkaline phosphatase D
MRIPDPRLLGRREFVLQMAQLGAAALAACSRTAPTLRSLSRLGITTDPFTLGVASGDPTPGGVVLWTRLAPALGVSGGMPPQPVEVGYEIAADDSFRSMVRRGTTVAGPELAHSVHVEVDGLESDRPYWYRFVAGDVVSPIGRTFTAPRFDADVGAYRFAFASCQHYEQGLYTAHQHLAAEDVRLLVHLGDYIYEGGPAAATTVRKHDGPEITTLDAYRRRYALYKADPHLRASHAAFPWVVTWDDHEVENNYAADRDENGNDPAVFLRRRAAAYQAYYEHMPLRRAFLPRGADLRLHRRLDIGRAISFHILDTRQYRSDQPCGDGNRAACAAALDPARTMLGRDQERWLHDGLRRSGRRWNVLGNQVPLASVAETVTADGPAYSMDKWAGYVAERNRLTGVLADVSNPVVITGDVHVSWVADVKRDPSAAGSPTVATELVGTSISSGGNGTATSARATRLLANNPHVSFYNGLRGYVRCDVSPDRLTAEYRTVEFVDRPGAPVATAARFVVNDGRRGAVR